jgi:hypothetical protein
MADKTISALTGATTPLAGTEVLPIVQGGSTVKVSVANLTAGRPVSATSLTASAGNVVIGTAGNGVDFSANTGTAGMTSELLNWYEEGTWTPTDTSGAGLTFVIDHAKYTRIGRTVTINLYLTFPVTASAANTEISLPFVCAAYDLGAASSNSGGVVSMLTVGGASRFSFRGAALAPLTNATLSGAAVIASVSYFV